MKSIALSSPANSRCCENCDIAVADKPFLREVAGLFQESCGVWVKSCLLTQSHWWLCRRTPSVCPKTCQNELKPLSSMYALLKFAELNRNRCLVFSQPSELPRNSFGSFHHIPWHSSHAAREFRTNDLLIKKAAASKQIYSYWATPARLNKT